MVFVLVSAMLSVTAIVLLYKDYRNSRQIRNIETKLKTYEYGQKRQAEKTEKALSESNGRTGDEPTEPTDKTTGR